MSRKNVHGKGVKISRKRSKRAIDATRSIEMALATDGENGLVKVDKEYMAILELGVAGHERRAKSLLNDFYDKHPDYDPHERGLAPNNGSMDKITENDPLKEDKKILREHIRGSDFWGRASYLYRKNFLNKIK